MLRMSPALAEAKSSGCGRGNAPGVLGAQLNSTRSPALTSRGANSPRRSLPPCRSTTIGTLGNSARVVRTTRASSAAEMCDALSLSPVAPARVTSTASPNEAGPSVAMSSGLLPDCPPARACVVISRVLSFIVAPPKLIPRFGPGKRRAMGRPHCPRSVAFQSCFIVEK